MTSRTHNTLPVTSDDRLIWDTWLSLYHLPVVTVADEVGTFDALSEAPLDTAALATKLKVDARALQIHLGLLAALGLLERRDGRWRATAASRTWLHSQADGYWGPFMHRFRQAVPLHGQLLKTLQTGGGPTDHASAANEWERGEMPADMARWITAYMNAHSRAAALAVAAQPMFATASSVLDVGGGSAIFAIEMARRHPGLRATVLEIAAICAEADGFIRAAGTGDQVQTLALNMFTETWPSGHDVHFMSNIFHDWSDATCRKLAAKSFEALPKDGHVVLHEMLMDDDGCGPLATAAFSVLMLLGTRGRQYAFGELRAFLESVGFVDVQSVRTGGGYYSIVTARKP